MAIRTLTPLSETKVNGLMCREEQVALRMRDGAIWQLDKLLVPLGMKSFTLRGAGSSLRSQLTGRRRDAWWRLVHAAPTVGVTQPVTHGDAIAADQRGQRERSAMGWRVSFTRDESSRNSR